MDGLDKGIGPENKKKNRENGEHMFQQPSLSFCWTISGLPSLPLP
jgi:hypothetical protein